MSIVRLAGMAVETADFMPSDAVIAPMISDMGAMPATAALVRKIGARDVA